MSGPAVLSDLLHRAVAESPAAEIVHVFADGSERVLLPGELADDAARIGAGLRAAGVAPGRPVLLVCGAGDAFVRAFWGATAAGVIPVPLALEEDKLRRVWTKLAGPPLIVDDMTAPLLAPLAATGMIRVLALSELLQASPLDAWHPTRPDDVAFLQFSSGSTGAPKGVVVRHRNLVHNIAQQSAAVRYVPDDVVVSWMPYFHDLGLIGMHLAPVAVGAKQVRIDPLHFVKRPVVWLEALDRHRGTVTGAASFALGLVCKRVTDEQIAAFDLSRIRLFGVGAEPISPRMCRVFAAKLAPSGFDGKTIAALYGLAEATLGVSCTPAGEPMRVHALDRAQLAQGRAVDAASGPDTVEMTELGPPVPDCRIRVVDDDDRELPDDRVGHIQVAGAHVTTGYYDDEQASAALHCGEWLRTGDVGFLRAGRLTLTGRAKEMLIVNGRNFYASDLEAVALGVPGVRPGRVAVVGYRDVDGDVERVVAFIGRERTDTVESMATTVRAVRAALRRALAHEHVEVLPIEKHAFPRTTSGKLQRVKLRKQVEAGEHRALAEQVAAVLAVEPVEASAASEVGADRSAEPALPAPSSAAAPELAEVEGVVRGVWAQVLERAPEVIERDADFRDLGGTSLRAMEVLAGLEDVYGRVFEPAMVRDCATVRALAARVHELMAAPTATPREARHPAVEAGAARADLAVLAAACRFPDADSPEQFWQNLLDGVDSVGEVPADRWSAAELEPGAPRWGAFLAHVDQFDGAHFGMGDDEAAFTDPHQRLMLEVAHEALERAGYAGERRVGKRVGMFVAVSESEYQRLLEPALARGASFPVSAIVGNLRNLIAARLSQCLDLTGPAIAVDTACSSALVALHLARASLLAGECDLAVVGAVSLNLTSTAHRMFARAEALSPTGRCHTFSAEADGFVPGEGAGAVVLARHADAQRDLDQVLALVRGSAINNDGRSMSAMAPNPVLQAAVIADAYRVSGVDPDSVDFIEAHGTGTAIGDPIEVRSLATTFSPPADGSRRVVGSVKTNIGHLLNAAGMPGLIKAVLSLHNRQLAPSLHYATPSPRFDLAASGFEVLTGPRAWTRANGPLRAAVNAFGFGGTNAHVILEQAPAAADPPRVEGPSLLTLSARTDDALRAASTSLAAFARGRPEVAETRVAACASVARDHLGSRLALVGEGDLAERLDEAARRVSAARAGRPRIAFLFAGQGSQRPGQGVALYRRWPVFRAAVDRLSQVAGPIAGRSLVDWLIDDGADAEQLRETEVAQPALVAFELALAELWADWGIAPRAVAGHSVGELAAAAVAGALTAEDAVRIAVERGRLMGAVRERGAMAAVFADVEAVRAALGDDAGRASIAAINAPNQVAISGAADAVERVCARLDRAGLAARPLVVSHAFHSPLMDPVIEPLRAFVAGVAAQAPRLPWISTVTGEPVAAEWRAPAYFAEHVARPVRFAAALDRLAGDAIDTFVELGPKRTLTPLVTRVLPAGGAAIASVDGVDDVRAALTAAGALWERGAPLRRGAIEVTRQPWVTVPTYPFERRRHWAPGARPVVSSAPAERPSAAPGHALPALGLLSRVDALHLDRAEVSGELRGGDPVVADHEVCDFHIAPGAALWQLALEAADHVSAEPRRRLADVTLFAPLRVDRNERRPVTVGLRSGDGGYAFELRAGVGADAVLVATGRVERGGGPRPEPVDLAAVERRCTRELAVSAIYQQLAARGMVHGPFYQCLTALRTGEREALGRLALSERAVARGGAFALHPALIDASMQVVAGLALGADGDAGGDGLYIPFSIEALELYEPIVGPCVSHVRVGELDGGRAFGCDVTVCGEDGRVLAALRGLELRRVTREVMRELCAPARVERLLHRVAWREVEAPGDGALPERVWIVPDGGELHATVAGVVAAAGARCATVSAEEAAARLAGGAGAPDAILYLAGLGLGAPRSRGALERGVERGLLALTRLARAIDARTPDQRPGRLLALTSDACGIAGARPVGSPLAAAIATYAACLADELPGFEVRAVDVSSSAAAAEVAEIARRELGARGGARRVAWVGERRHELRVEAGAPAADAGRRPRLRDDSVLLITGGATGVGAALARSLAAPGRRLVLVGRTPLERDAARAAVVEELARDCASARYVCADVTDAAAVTALVADVIAVEGRLTGVVHAAGVADPDRLAVRDDARVRAVLAPKIVGGWLLAKAVADADCALDVFALCSSVSAVLPGLGGAMADYAAANGFLDGLAGAERADGQPFVSIDWSIWGETGMGAHPGTIELVRRNGLEPLATRDAVAAFRAALATGGVQVVVADRAAEAPREPREALIAAGSTQAPQLDLSGLSLERALQTLVGAALAVPPEQVPTDQSFLALGLDSLAAVDLVKKLERHLGRTLSTTLFFEYDTIDRLTAYLGDGVSPAASAPAPAIARGAGDDEPFALTPVQRAFYANHYLYPDVTAYAYLRLNLAGAVDVEALGRALALLEVRHPMLRVRFSAPADGAPRQWTRAAAEPAPRAPEWFSVVDGAPDPEAFDHGLFNARFDLAAGEAPLRAALWRRTPEMAYLGLCLHHIAGDAWSLNILADELWRAYSALVAGDAPALPALAARFSDCAVWRGDDDQARRARDLAYWRAALADHRAARAAALPYDGDPDDERTGAFAALRARVDGGLVSALRARASAADVSLVHLLMAAYGRCLARWTGQGAVGINVARAGREARVPGIERVVGSFADTLPLYVDCGERGGATELARRLRDVWLASERHGAVTTVDLANLLGADGVGPRVAASASFSFARFPVELAADCPLRIDASAGGTASAATRLGLAGWEHEGALLFSWSYPERLFARATIERFAGDYLDELAAIAEQRELPAAPASAARTPSSVVEQILARCRRHPERVAVEAGDRILRYGELDDQSARVAAALRARGAGSGQLVGLLTRPGADAFAGIVGILRAGAAWVPLDPEHPPRRLIGQLERAGVELVVCHGPTRAVASELGRGLALVDAGALDSVAAPSEPAVCDPAATAYVIHTSGSTGHPKAVPIRYASMHAYLQWAIETFGYTERDRLAQTSSLCFDASVRQVLAPLMVGATAVVVDRELARDPERLLETIDRARLTVWSSVPSLWARLLALIEDRVTRGARPPALAELRWLHVGGEALSAASVRRWMELYGARHRISNLYGPTEATINATCFVVRERPADGETRVPIGAPVADTRLKVVADDGRECAAGEIGELWIGGGGLSPGYLGDAALTARAFVVDADGERWYRSGDRVVTRADGQLEFVGRVDDQVKLRGYRVEPGEIEAVLEQHDAVHRAAVIVDGERLGAFVEARGELDATALRRFAAERLPDYMVPGAVEVVAQLPRTSTGKLDRAALRAGAVDPAATVACAPPSAAREPTATERVVAEAWAAVLGVPTVGLDDDFFHLGGDSLLILEVFARLEGRVPRLPRPTVLYRHRTVAALAAAIERGAAEATDERGVGEPAADGDAFGLAPAQVGFLIAEAVQPGAGTTWSARCRIDGPLDRGLFQRALDFLVERHGMLRTVFPPRDGIGAPQRQRERVAARLPLAYEDLSAAGDAAVDARWRAHLAEPMSPTQWPLLRTALLRTAPDRHLWLVTAHHLIGDGYSAALLGRELVEVYEQLAAGRPPELPPLRTTFRDYVEYMAREARRDRAADEAYWREQLGAPYTPPVLRSVPDSEVGAAEIVLDGPEVERLRAIASASDTTLYSVLLTAFARAASALTARDELIVGTAVSGRDVPLADITRVFGCFATTLPVRVRTAGGALAEDVTRVHRVFTEARERALPPDRIARLMPGRSPAQTLGAQLFFTYLDFEGTGAGGGSSLALHWDDGGVGMDPPPQTDLLVAARRGADGLRVTVKGRGVGSAALARFVDRLRADLARPARGRAPATVDAALIGYLPAVRDIAALLGGAARGAALAAQPDVAALLADGAEGERAREQTRALLGLGAAPRALEVLETPLGRSAFVCLPRFADQLTSTSADALAAEVERGIEIAAGLGARCVSLAGMLPALTRYGYAIGGRVGDGVRVTTGHAATAVSVVKTLLAATRATDGELAAQTIAFVGVGSIGRSSLQLLLSRVHPKRLVLCDAVGHAGAVAEFVVAVRDSGYHGDIALVEGSMRLPRPVYEADVIVGAASTPALLDIDALRPGTVVVDDSFPHIFEPARAIERMRTRGDVLIVGGGLLDCRTTERHPTLSLELPAPIARTLSGVRPPGVVASCQLESLLCAAHPELPTVRGLVEPDLAREYWDVVERSGIDAAALHLQYYFPDDDVIAAVRAARARAQSTA